ncbi:Bicupin, oxalate decarboxylase/oxidase [Diplocarpon rosae]|nr:Bicupin, oxalate decarboxylase/oxidase [Diplocarpon rosae]
MAIKSATTAATLVLVLAAVSPCSLAAPTGTSADPAPSSLLGYSPAHGVVNQETDDISFSLLPAQTQDAKIGDILDFNHVPHPQPIRGTKGGTDPGPRSEGYDVLNPDKLAPPGTDHGSVANAEWPLGLSHAKLGLGRAGWSRQQNIDNMPAATEMAGVDMRLEEGGYRELHWHKAAEWSYILNGSVRVEAVTEEGQTFVDDLSAGDVWYFPPGVPHSLQGLKGGVEFLLVFDDGSFSEDNTFLASEVFATVPVGGPSPLFPSSPLPLFPSSPLPLCPSSHLPPVHQTDATKKSVLSKNFGGLPLSAWADIPAGELFIFPGTPAPTDIAEQNIVGPAGVVPRQNSFSYHLSKRDPDFTTAGGSVKIIDPTTFPVADQFSAAIVTVKPGAMREIHWHPTAAQGNARTFDYHPGDCGYIPKSTSHYVENIGTDDVIFIEVLQADHFSDISVGQWVGLLPPQIIMDTLNLSHETVAQFKKEKQRIVQG